MHSQRSRPGYPAAMATCAVAEPKWWKSFEDVRPGNLGGIPKFRAQLLSPPSKPGFQKAMIDIVSFALGGVTVAFLAIVASMGGDCVGAANKVKEDPAELVNQFKVQEMTMETKSGKVCC
ncbi:unnamed protein product [Effrenium voratum]|nr:unnamed protein product [Effrenium voratum]